MEQQKYTVEVQYEPAVTTVTFEGVFLTLRGALATWFNADRVLRDEATAIRDFYPLLVDVKRDTIARREMERARLTANKSRSTLEALDWA